MVLIAAMPGPSGRCEATFDVCSTVTFVRERLQALVHAEGVLRRYFLLVAYAGMSATMIGEACVGNAECETAGVQQGVYVLYVLALLHVKVQNSWPHCVERCLM